MINRTKWTERKFNHDLPEGWLLNVLERLHGTAPRIKHLISGLSEEQSGAKTENSWSLKEHIGHLSDLEELHEGRIDDFIACKEVLRAADMSNQKTHKADHNARIAEDLLAEFETKRKAFIDRLSKLDSKTQSFRSLHPRLKLTMKPVDMAFFTAEHDDHHLATMRQLVLSMNRSEKNQQRIF